MVIPTNSTNGSAGSHPKSKTWIWYFALLALLSIVMTGTLIAFNLRQQLAPDQLEAALTRWKRAGITDYDMEYTKEMATKETYLVRVRKGEVTSVTLDGNP